MQTPLFARYQFLDDAAFNAASSAVSGNFTTLTLATMTPGVVRPDVVAVAATGLSIGVSLPAPFGVLFNSGVLATAHGTSTGLDSQSYTVSVASLVPASGTTTVFIAAISATIQQQPYTVIGPPPGHPNFTPNFVPFTAYAQTVDSLSIVATAFKPNNTTSFEICRMTLTAGSSSISALDLSHQVLAAPNAYINPTAVNGNKTLALADVGVLQEVNAAAAFVTLPLASGFVGKQFPLFAALAPAFTLQTQGSDLILGVGIVPSSGVAAFSMIKGTALTVVSDGTNWVALSGAGYAPIFNPALTGTPRAPTASAGTGGTQIATNAYADTSAAAALAAAEAFANSTFLPLTGGTLTGSLVIATPTGNANLFIDGASGTTRQIIYRTAGSNRWTEGANSTAEIGANAGSNWFKNALSDTGALLGSVYTINRASQVLAFVQSPTVPTPAALDGSTNAASTFYSDRANATTLAAAEAYTNANFLPLSGGNVTGNLGVIRDGENIAAQLTISGDNSQNKALNFETGSSLRAQLVLDNETESGAAAGSNVVFGVFTNAGVFIANIFKIFRNTQIFQFLTTPTVPNLGAGDASFNVPNTNYVDRQALVNNIAPMSVTSTPGVTIGASFNQTRSFTFSAPCKGTVFATGCLNVSDFSTNAIASANITATLSINGTGVGADTTPTPQFHQGVLAVASGATVTVAINVVTTTMPTAAKGTFSCGCVFVPTL